MFFFKKSRPTDLKDSKLFNETSFFSSFTKDLLNAKEEVIIESPFIASSRMAMLLPIFQKLIEKGVKIHIITRDPLEHDEDYRYIATELILKCSECDINIVLLRGFHHRKIAIIDKRLLWEGSLNILSFSRSQEVMRRIEGERQAKEMLGFTNITNFI